MRLGKDWSFVDVGTAINCFRVDRNTDSNGIFYSFDKNTRDTCLDLDSFTLFYTANCNVTVAVTYLELDNVTSKLDANFLCISSKSVN